MKTTICNICLAAVPTIRLSLVTDAGIRDGGVTRMRTGRVGRMDICGPCYARCVETKESFPTVSSIIAWQESTKRELR